MVEISNPHDKFFKEVFSRREVAVDLLRNYLPQEVFSLLDEDSWYCQEFCINFPSVSFLREGRLLPTFPMGFECQLTSILRQMKASNV